MTVSETEEVAASWQALHGDAALIDRSDRARLRMDGPKAAEVMNGLVTNEVTRLIPGEGQYAAALTPKGRIIADVRIFRTDEGLVADVAAASAPGFLAMIRKYVNPRLASYRDVTAETTDLSVFGPRAEAVVALAAEIPGESSGLDAGFQHRELTIAGVPVRVARIPDAGLPGFALFAPVESKAELRGLLIAAGAHPASHAALDIARVEAGRPEWGRDMDESNLAQEANLDTLGAISYEKGCYTGQETVARLHFRGHVNRLLRGLVLDRGDVPAGATVWQGDKQVGDVRSVVVSPRLGPIAMAMIRREVAIDDVLEIRFDDTRGSARVVQLPFA
jgi:folate-binding protein YgfZ